MHDLSENSPRENFSSENLMKYRTSSRREQERLRRALEEQAAWAREQQRIADEQRQVIERRQAELRRRAMPQDTRRNRLPKEIRSISSIRTVRCS